MKFLFMITLALAVNSAEASITGECLDNVKKNVISKALKDLNYSDGTAASNDILEASVLNYERVGVLESEVGYVMYNYWGNIDVRSKEDKPGMSSARRLYDVSFLVEHNGSGSECGLINARAVMSPKRILKVYSR